MTDWASIAVRPEGYRTITFVPLFDERNDGEAARWLRSAANGEARRPARVATMPRSGIAFFQATGEAARQLDLIWAQLVPAETTPVVVTLDHPELPGYLEGLDAAIVVGVPGGDLQGRYAGMPNVEVVPTGNPPEVLLAAVRAWNDPADPAFLLPGVEPTASTAAPRESSEPDFFDSIFEEEDPARRNGAGHDVAPEAWGALPDEASPDPAPPSGAGRVADDPLAALAALKPVPVDRPQPERHRVRRQRDEAPPPADEEEKLPAATPGLLGRARRAFARRRAIEVPGEIGDLLLGTRPAPLVAVGSRKGGVGKTALSAGLAQVAGYSLDGRAGIAALVDQNINNADQWGRLMLPGGTTTVREVMAQLEQGRDFPGAPAYARTPALAVFPESRDPGDGYPPLLIERFVGDLRARYVFSVVDLPNALPAFTSAESSVAASYIQHADLVIVPTTDDPNALRGALEYLESPSMRRRAAVVPYIVSTERGIRDHPKVLELLEEIRRRAVAVVPFPKTEKATLAVVRGASILDVDPRLRNAYIDLASTVARTLVRGV